MLLAASFMGVVAQDVFRCGEGGGALWYRVLGDGRSVELTHPEAEWPYYGEAKPRGRLVLPSEVSHDGRLYAVAGVGENAFYRCDGIEEVVLPAGCLYVGVQAFNGCTSLRSVAFGSRLAEVREGAFAYCTSLAEVELPLSLRKLGISAFAMCTSLTRVLMSDDARATCNHLTFLGTPIGAGAKNVKNGR